MREGLRSRTRLGKVSGGGGGVETVGVKNEALDSGGEGSGAPETSIEKKGEVKRAVKEECDLDLDVRTSGNAGLAGNGNNRSFVGGEGSIVEADAGRKANEVVIWGRVLRSRSKRGEDKRSCSGENDGVFSGNSRGHGEFERIKVKKEYEEADELVTDANEKEKVKVKKGGNGKKKVKRKRGRPPKKEPQEQEQLVDQSPRKRGRPPKIESQEQEQLVDQSPHKRGRPPKIESQEQEQLVDQLPCKRGRPHKTGPQNLLVTVVHDRKGKAGIQEGKGCLTVRDSGNMNAIDDTRSRRSSGKELKKKGFSPVKKNKLGMVLKTENDEAASPSRSNTVNALLAEKCRKSKTKKLVRDKIMEQLSAAGWTVDYRPRNGREYHDAVYVSLDKHTHWSITLAYNRLKMHYEAGDGEGKLYKPGFRFTPIPEEDFNILTKVIIKRRKSKDKKAPFVGKGGKTVDGANGKEKKVKPGFGAGTGKSVKGKMKRKQSLLEEGNSNVTSPNLVRDHKRHKTQNKKRCGLLVRNAKEEGNSEIDGYVPYSGKRTLLAWMIDLGTILPNGKVRYMQHEGKLVLLEGKITGDGIHCGCCNEIATVSEFGAHSRSRQSDPLKSIYIEEGTSLLQCLLDSWNKQDESERKGFHFIDVAGQDPNDDTCGVCGDGGDLICCDGCPSTFHQSCLDIKNCPSGDWHCVYCCCKFCGLVSGSSNRSDVYDDFTMSALLTCHLCEEKFHRSCIEANGGKTNDSRDAFFCGNSCQELSKRLEMLLGVKHEIEDGFSWSFIRRSDVGFDASQIKPQMVECNSKLAVALSVMDECFMPYIDHRSGINLIRSILYNCGSNFKRLNYSGFVTAILERGDEIVAAASIRIHGNQLAEMPFIGTRYMYRRQGMCRRLLNAIERALSSLNVELLVIPAISELRETWTSVFGFEPLESTNKQIIKNMNVLVFPYVDMLQKKISKDKFASENMIPTEVSELEKNDTIYRTANWDGAGSSGSHSISPTGIPPSDTCQINDKIISIESEDVSDSCHRAEDKERRCLSVSRVNTEGSEGHRFGALLVTENFSSEVKGAYQVVSNNNSAEDSAPYGAESIPIYSQVVFRTRESKDSADIIHHDSQKISDSCELRYKTDHGQPYFIRSKEEHAKPVNGCGSHSRPNGDCASGEAVLTTNVLMQLRSQNIAKDLPVNCEKNSSVSVINAPHVGEAELCYAKTTNLQTNTNPGDCKSILISSGICQEIADCVNERNKTPSAAEADFLPADTEVIPNNEPEMKGSSELAEPDLQVDQTAWSNASSLCAPNTVSNAALHWASAGSTSCGSTEGIVLSNQVS